MEIDFYLLRFVCYLNNCFFCILIDVDDTVPVSVILNQL